MPDGELKTSITPRLDPLKFKDPHRTADGHDRASVELNRLRTLWFNTGTLCNIECSNCYIESSPKNDRLVYLTAREVSGYLDEIAIGNWGTEEIAFTGGEPFMNPEIFSCLEACLERGYSVLLLTNAMKPMHRYRTKLLNLLGRFGDQLTIRVSIDHYEQDHHESLRGTASWQPMLEGLKWLASSGFNVDVAGRTCWEESDAQLRVGYQKLFDSLSVDIDAGNPARLVLFPEMSPQTDVPEITTDCWDILDVTPNDLMCASSRMVVKRKGADRPMVVPCTLLPYETEFEMGPNLSDADGKVALNHPHCARFCVLGGGACSVE